MTYILKIALSIIALLVFSEAISKNFATTYTSDNVRSDRLRFDGYYSQCDSIDVNGTCLGNLQLVFHQLIFFSDGTVCEITGSRAEWRVVENYQKIVDGEDSWHSWGTYEVKNDTIRATINSIHWTSGMTRKHVTTNYEGMLASGNRIINWKAVPPYPDLFGKEKYKRHNNNFTADKTDSYYRFIPLPEVSMLKDPHLQPKVQEKIAVPPDPTVFSLTPVNKHKVVNGLAFGLSAHTLSSSPDTLSVNVNGINVEVGPFGIIGGTFGLLHGLAGGIFFANLREESSKHHPKYGTYHPKYGTHIKGLSISIFGISDTYNYGVFVNGLSSDSYSTRGVQVTGLANTSRHLQGVSIAGIANIAAKAEGFQLGLINNCGTGNVLQIGLFNRIGKRVTPFINFRFKREK